MPPFQIQESPDLGFYPAVWSENRVLLGLDQSQMVHMLRCEVCSTAMEQQATLYYLYLRRVYWTAVEAEESVSVGTAERTISALTWARQGIYYIVKCRWMILGNKPGLSDCLYYISLSQLEAE